MGDRQGEARVQVTETAVRHTIQGARAGEGRDVSFQDPCLQLLPQRRVLRRTGRDNYGRSAMPDGQSVLDLGELRDQL